MSNINAGTARIDITPSGPISMGGFGQRTTESVGVHDPIWTKALFLSNGQEKLLLITSDLIAIPGALSQEVVSELVDKVGLTPAQICMTASHTHSGPAVRKMASRPSKHVDDYLDFLTSALVDVAEEAVQNAAPSELKTAKGEVDFLINRRTRGNPNIVDDRVYALSVEDPESGETKAALFGCSCHPVCVGYENYEISADYPGYAQRFVEEQLPTANALFFNMAEGNMIPSTREPWPSMDPRGYDGAAFEDAEEIGSRLSAEIVKILKDTPVRESLTLSCLRRDCSVLLNKHDLDSDIAWQEAGKREVVISEYLGEDYFAEVTPGNLSPLESLWADACKKVVEEDMDEPEMRRLLSSICQYRVYLTRALDPARGPVDVPIQVININEYAFLALPGEILVEVSFAWQDALRSDNAFIIGLANDTFGYLPHSSNFEEPDAERRYETIMTALKPGAADILVEEAAAMYRSEAE